MYSISVTQLESFLMCPKKYIEVWFSWDAIKMFLWDIAHIAHRYPNVAKRQAKLFYQHIQDMWREVTNEYHNLMQIIKEAEVFIESNNTKNIYYELKLWWYIEWVRLTWTLDCVIHDTLKNKLDIVDFKTTGSLSYYKDTDDKLQKSIYSYLLMNLYWIKETTFTYKVYQTWTNIKQEDYKEVFLYESVKKLVEDNVKLFCLIKDSWVYYPQVNKFCFWCPLYKSETALSLWKKQCDLYIDKSRSVDVEEYDFF